ncbi:hypothetical protein GCM10007939_11850 [Amylibacter marinus]|uniref:DUF1178 family protein n=1 Tax=Amylibacter marinus TaxID=1475483 RepID=A0ABQ5VTY3_9RHOB|nr:DUF1178 family protein [Amylibacter marinus]GLQ34902.1 hypothetical protein GCM10007939_11850 [Amylibacter marinus]
MIKYTLKCENGHQFDSWFDGLSAYERLERAKLLGCTVCGSTGVTRAIMAPQVSPARSKAEAPLTAPASPEEEMISKMRKTVEENSENVGSKFAAEARKIHEGTAPERAIHGEAKLDDAKKLIKDGIPVLPLPWANKKTN